MTPEQHIRRLRDACQGIDEHAGSNGAVWTALHDIELDIHELDKAFEDWKLMDKEKSHD